MKHLILGLGITVGIEFWVSVFKKMLLLFKYCKLDVNISFSFQMVALPKMYFLCQNFDESNVRKHIELISYFTLREYHIVVGLV